MLPHVEGKDAFWLMKKARGGRAAPAVVPRYEPIEVPRNSGTGFITAFFAVITGFALIWHIWWMVGLGVVGAFVTMLAFAWRDVDEIEIPAAELARMDRAGGADITP